MHFGRFGCILDRVNIDSELLERVGSTTGLSESESARVIADVIAFYSEPVADVVRRRHAELHHSGQRNREIYARIARELPERVVAGPTLSERQVRRLIYG